MWEALCVSARRRGAQTEEAWRDRRQSSQRTCFRLDSHKPAGVERQAGCWKVSKTARQRVLIDKNLVQTFLRSVLCNPLFRKMIEMWFWRCRENKRQNLCFCDKRRPLRRSVIVVSSLPSPSTHHPPKAPPSKTRPNKPCPIALHPSRSALLHRLHGSFVLFSPVFVFNCCDGGQLISTTHPPPTHAHTLTLYL